MKKIVSLVLVLCMMVFAFSALAEQATTTTTGTESGDSSALFAASGESEGADSGESEGADGDALMEAIGATKAEEIKTVAADSAEKFYGTFTVSKMIMLGYAIDVAAMTTGEGAAATVTFSAEGVTSAGEDGQPKLNAFDSCELVDGVLNVVSEGTTIKLALTEDGGILMNVAIDAENEIGLLLAPVK